ncbi:hypothetical protein QTG54_001205 [Skeletonema marinoi]|uniref:Uncharacterized protein n=1 Tax=Skeletonema marinoi TaxID=267567 RepID=A0AAD8YQC2_9STRA|nr:hypothetical protein QTG54_001205 [Skeletonema marinoi]
MSKLARQLKFYAETYPKASSAALIGGTALAFAAVVGFIEVQDIMEAKRHTVAKREQNVNYTEEAQLSTTSAGEVTPQEAQLAAMLENAKNSSWQDNLRNAADAQERFMLPGRDVDEGNEKPEYIKRIVDRSEEILQEDKARKEKEIEESKDPFTSRFWK